MRALICEDDNSIRNLVRIILQREGFEVDTAEDGIEATDKALRGGYEVILLDVMMPGMDGHQVLEQLKNRRPDDLKRIVLMTATAVGDGEAEPICSILPKPFDIDQLVASARSCAAECAASAIAARA